MISTERSDITDISEWNTLDSSPTQAAFEKYSTIHESIQNALKCSMLLNAIHVEVSNESYWYNMRKSLGPKKHAALIVKQNTTTMQWESYIFKMKLKEEELVLKPKKINVGSHKSRWHAYKSCEKACKERDENPAKLRKMALIMDKNKILSTHFRIFIVSDFFHHMNDLERIMWVNYELIQAIGINPTPDDGKNEKNVGFGRTAPEKIKFASTIKENFCSLPLFRFFYSQEVSFTLMIVCKTPSQWRPADFPPPLSERMGRTHNELKSIEVTNSALPKSQIKRIKRLSVCNKSSSIPTLPDINNKNNLLSNSLNSINEEMSMESARKSQSSQKSRVVSKYSKISTNTSLSSGNDDFPFSIQDSLGIDPAISGVKYKKLGGIYGHFFNDLSPEIRAMVMDKYKDNKHLIQLESSLESLQFSQQKPTGNEPKTTMSKLRAKMNVVSNLSEYDKGTMTENEMMEVINISQKRMDRAAIRLQRIRRITLWHRSLKLLWKLQYFAITCQRLLRGYFGRQYVKLFRILRPKAAIKIQHCFRNARNRYYIKIWRKISYHLVRELYPRVKNFIRNFIKTWKLRRYKAAIKMQSIIRVGLAKSIIKKKLRLIMENKKAILIQKHYRGLVGRKIYEVKKEEYYHLHIRIPAAIEIQRIYRGKYAKNILNFLKYRMKCCIKIQKNAKIYVKYKWDKQVFYEKTRKIASIKIQKLFRGVRDREIFNLKKHDYWFKNKYIPTIIFIQSIIRRCNSKRKVQLLRKHNENASFIQNAYRKYVVRVKARILFDHLRLGRKYLLAMRIQSLVRGFLARKQYSRRLLEYKGKITLAAKIIARAWKNYQLALKFEYLMDERREELLTRKIRKLGFVRNDILTDIREIKHDIAAAKGVIERLKKRQKDLEEFELQCSLRSVKVKKEMEKLTVEDFERGWAEALGGEYECINHQALMAREELRLIRNKIKKQLSEILTLQFEWEEAEMEIDYLEVAELETIEARRRNEIIVKTRKVDRIFKRKIRREKSHWKVRSTRVKVIKNNRPRYRKIVTQNKEDRDLDYAETISFEKKIRQWDKEDIKTQKQLNLDASLQDIENKPKTYEEYAGSVQDTYDIVVGRALNLVRGATLDERAARLREEHRLRQLQKKKNRRGQFAPLKPEFQMEKYIKGL